VRQLKQRKSESFDELKIFLFSLVPYVSLLVLILVLLAAIFLSLLEKSLLELVLLVLLVAIFLDPLKESFRVEETIFVKSMDFVSALIAWF